MEAFASNWLASCSRTPSMLSRISAITNAATKRIDLTGVPPARIQAREPLGRQVVPPCGHRQQRQPGENQAGVLGVGFWLAVGRGTDSAASPGGPGADFS